MAYLNHLQRLILHAALADRDTALDAFTEWQKAVPLDDIHYSDLRLIPLIYTNIGEWLPEPTSSRLKGIKRHTWIRNRYRVEICAQLLARMAKQNIPAMLLKGAALMASITNDFGTRQMGDCDLLVSKPNRRAALSALSSLGFQSIPYDWRELSEEELDVFHGLTFELTGKISDVTDLHWRPMREIGSDEFTAEIFSRSKSILVSGQQARVPAPEDMFLHCAVHGTEFLPRQRYDWLADAALILRESKQFDWNVVMMTANKYRLGSLLHASLKVMADELPIKIPTYVIAEMKPKRSQLVDRLEAATRSGKKRESFVGEAITLIQCVRRRSSHTLNLPTLSAIPQVWRLLTCPNGASGLSNGEELAWYPYGWHHAEPSGRWSQFRFATIALRASKSGFGDTIRIEMKPFLPSKQHQQRVGIFAGFKKLALFHWHPKLPQPSIISINLPPSLQQQKILSLQIYSSKLFCPARYGASTDQREIGVFISDIRTRPLRHDLTHSPISLCAPNADKQLIWQGFYEPEVSGTWASDRLSELRWEQIKPLPNDSWIEVGINSVVTGRFGQISVDVYLNNKFLGKLRFDHTSEFPCKCSFQIPVEELVSRFFKLQFKFNRWLVSSSGDNRKLSIMLNLIQLHSRSIYFTKEDKNSSNASGITEGSLPVST